MKLKIAPENLKERIALALNLAPVPLIDTQIAFNAARAIMAAAETGVFEALGRGEKHAEEVASLCGTHPEATRQLLDCLAGIGYLNWSDGRYALRPRYYKWLLADSPSNLIGKLRFQISEWNWMASLENYVRTGKPMELHAVINPDEWSAYQDGMRDLSVNTAKELAGRLRLPSGASDMLDIGGSHGLYSIELCKRYPGLASTILELPGAIDRASAIAAQHHMGDRIQYKAGNALTDELGTERYDLIMINNVVHHFTAAENRTLALKAAQALKPGGMYAIGDFIRQKRPGEGGAVASVSGLYFALTSSSGTWAVDEMQEWQRSAGLKPGRPIGLISLPGWKMLPASS